MDFHFDSIDPNTTKPYRKAIEHASIDPDLSVLKFDVDLDGLQTPEGREFEVIANFHVSDFDNDKTLNTDSNGIEM